MNKAECMIMKQKVSIKICELDIKEKQKLIENLEKNPITTVLAVELKELIYAYKDNADLNGSQVNLFDICSKIEELEELARIGEQVQR